MSSTRAETETPNCAFKDMRQVLCGWDDDKMELMLAGKSEVLKDIVLPIFDGIQLSTADSRA